MISAEELALLDPDAVYVLLVYRAAHAAGKKPPMPTDVAEKVGWGKYRVIHAARQLRSLGLLAGYTPT